MNIGKLTMFAGIFVSFLSINAAAEEIYVNPSAVSAGNGTYEQPYGTIQEAQNYVRTRTKDMSENIYVILEDGIYQQDKTITFTSADSGENGFNVIYKAAYGAKPIISGGKQINSWSLYDADKNIWRAPVIGMTGRQLYVNGRKAIRARTEGPSELFSIRSVTDDGYILNANTDSTVPEIMSYGNISEAELIYSDRWMHQRMGIKSAAIEKDDTGSDEYYLHMERGFSDSEMKNKGKIVGIENAYELMDQPGEWYSDGQYIFYIPRTGEDMRSAEVTFPQLESLITGKGSTSAYVSNIIFDGIEFRYTTWRSPDSENGYPGQQGGFGIDVWGENETYGLKQAIRFDFADNITIENCTFTALGCAAIRFGPGTRNCRINGNLIYDIANGGIYLEEKNFYTNNLNDPKVIKNNEITNNKIYNIGTEYKSAVGIFCGYVCNTVIAHNELSDMPYSGISIGWGWGGSGSAAQYKTDVNSINNKIYANLIHDVMKELSDGGGIYNLGSQPGMQIFNNVVYNVGGLDGAAYYLDNGSQYVVLRNNIGYNAVNKIKGELEYATVMDNYFDDIATKEKVPENAVLENNVIISDGVYPDEIIKSAGIKKEQNELHIRGTIHRAIHNKAIAWIKDEDVIKYADVIDISDNGNFELNAIGSFEKGKTYTVVISETETEYQSDVGIYMPNVEAKPFVRIYVKLAENKNGTLTGTIVGAALNNDNDGIMTACAVYDSDGRMTDVKMGKINEYHYINKFSFEYGEGTQIKLYTWKSAESMVPIVDIVSESSDMRQKMR